MKIIYMSRKLQQVELRFLDLLVCRLLDAVGELCVALAARQRGEELPQLGWWWRRVRGLQELVPNSGRCRGRSRNMSQGAP